MLRIHRMRKFNLSIDPKFIQTIIELFDEYGIYYKKLDSYKYEQKGAKLTEMTCFIDCIIEMDRFKSFSEQLDKIPTSTPSIAALPWLMVNSVVNGMN